MFLTSASMMFALRLSECYHRGPEKTSSKELSRSYQAWEKGVNSALKTAKILVRRAQVPFEAKENALPAYKRRKRHTIRVSVFYRYEAAFMLIGPYQSPFSRSGQTGTGPFGAKENALPGI